MEGLSIFAVQKKARIEPGREEDTLLRVCAPGTEPHDYKYSASEKEGQNRYLEAEKTRKKCDTSFVDLPKVERVAAALFIVVQCLYRIVA